MQDNQIDNRSDLSLLFVHLGTKTPRYLRTNIERSRVLFPNLRISLVTDVRNLTNWAQKQDVEIINYQEDPAFNSAFKFENLESNFRNGYWRYTIERLIAINTFHNLHPQIPVLHLESDVILMPDFPLDKVSALTKIYWLKYGPRADIASILYTPNAEKTSEFCERLIDEIKNNEESDMELLWKLRTKFVNDYSTFPTMNAKTKSLLNIKSEKSETEISQKMLESNFDGLFDAAGIGIWISGGDPRNNFGFTTIHTRQLIDSGNIYIDSSKESFVSVGNGELRIETEGLELVPVYNLHVHSKNRRLLSAVWIPELEKLLRYKGRTAKVISFNIQILVQEISLNLRNKSFLRYILHLPPLKKLKRFIAH
jgi:hypothetical protein